MLESGRTTNETIDARRASIEFDLLPKTLRKAIVVTRLLGIPFIWMDALCIIQGDRRDWEKGSATIALIYSYAVVTIAAAKEDDCQRGFIKPEKIRLGDKLYSTIPRDHQKEFATHLVYESRLADKGWILQERELSSRIIHFTREYIIWGRRTKCSYYHIRSRYRSYCRDARYEPEYVDVDNWVRCLDKIK
jgi:hypothetical protein